MRRMYIAPVYISTIGKQHDKAVTEATYSLYLTPASPRVPVS